MRDILHSKLIYKSISKGLKRLLVVVLAGLLIVPEIFPFTVIYAQDSTASATVIPQRSPTSQPFDFAQGKPTMTPSPPLSPTPSLDITNQSASPSSTVEENPQPTPSPTPPPFAESLFSPTETLQSSPSVTVTIPPQWDSSFSSNPSATVRTRLSLRPIRQDFRLDEKIVVIADSTAGKILTASVMDIFSEKVPVDIERDDLADSSTFTIIPHAYFKPGKYTFMLSQSGEVPLVQAFTWGMLTLNLNKSVYQPGDKADVNVTVLDELGAFACNAELTVTINGPNTQSKSYSTTDDTLMPVGCLASVPRQPYNFNFTVENEGSYTISATAVLDTVTVRLLDSFSVGTAAPFSFARNGTPQLSPPEPAEMRFSVTTNEDFKGSLIEVVPESFAITALEKETAYDKIEIVPATGSEFKREFVTLRIPFDGSYRQTQGFGEKDTDPSLIKLYRSFGLSGHDGVDFALPIGTQVLAADSGEVVFSGPGGPYGTTIIIQHSWGKSYYGHLSQTISPIGSKVTKGEKIALSGNTGLSFGPHLHFTIKLTGNDPENGYYGKTDPAPYLTGQVAIANVLAKLLIWNVDLKKGETYNFGYRFRPPQGGPRHYVLGPLQLANSVSGQDRSTVFADEKSWVATSDAGAFALYSQSIPQTLRIKYKEILEKSSLLSVSSSDPQTEPERFFIPLEDVAKTQLTRENAAKTKDAITAKKNELRSKLKDRITNKVFSKEATASSSLLDLSQETEFVAYNLTKNTDGTTDVFTRAKDGTARYRFNKNDLTVELAQQDATSSGFVKKVSSVPVFQYKDETGTWQDYRVASGAAVLTKTSETPTGAVLTQTVPLTSPQTNPSTVTATVEAKLGFDGVQPINKFTYKLGGSNAVNRLVWKHTFHDPSARQALTENGQVPGQEPAFQAANILIGWDDFQRDQAIATASATITPLPSADSPSDSSPSATKPPTASPQPTETVVQSPTPNEDLWQKLISPTDGTAEVIFYPQGKTGPLEIDPMFSLATAATTFTVTSNQSPSWKAVWSSASGGIISEFYTPATSATNIVKSTVNQRDQGLFNIRMAVSAGSNESTIVSEGAARMTLLETTNGRVKIRSEGDLDTDGGSTDNGSYMEEFTVLPDRIAATGWVSWNNASPATIFEHSFNFVTGTFTNNSTATSVWMGDNDTAPALLASSTLWQTLAGVTYEAPGAEATMQLDSSTTDLTAIATQMPAQVTFIDEYYWENSATHDKLGFGSDSVSFATNETQSFGSVLKITGDDTSDGTQGRSYARDLWNSDDTTFTTGTHWDSVRQDLGRTWDDIYYDTFTDGFESGDTTRWSSETDTGSNFNVTTASVNTGTYGAGVTVGATVAYVTDTTPDTTVANPGRIRARFYLDPNTITMANGDEFAILTDNATAGSENIGVHLNFLTGTGYRIRACLQNDAGADECSGYVNLNDAYNLIEVEWGLINTNGYVNLWVNGAYGSQDALVDAGLASVTQFIWGNVVGRDAGTSGTIFLDDFKWNYISYLDKVSFDSQESAYAAAASSSTMTMDIDGNSFIRYQPSFKVRGYRSNSKPLSVVLENEGLVDGGNMLLDPKPLTQAFWSQDITWYSTLDASGNFTTPDIGNGTGSSIDTATFTTGRFGNGMQVDATTENPFFVSSGNISGAAGTIEFWYRNTIAPAVSGYFFAVDNGSGTVNMSLGRGGNDTDLDFIINDGTSHTNSWDLVDVTLYDGKWHHIRLTYDSTTDAPTLTLDGRLQTRDATSAWNSITPQTNTYIGNNSSTNHIGGIIDEFTVHNSASSPTKLAEGGDTSDTDEYLNDTSSNQTFSFAPVDSSNRGEYLYMGSDEQFSGLNVDLATAGVGASGSSLDTGDSSDGSITISSSINCSTTDISTTDDDAATTNDSDCYASNITSQASSGQANVTVSSAAGFVATGGDEVLIIQMTGSTAGLYEFRDISSVSSNTLTLTANLTNTYQSTGAQVVRVPQYTGVTVQSGGTLTASAWGGTTDGVLAFRASGTVTIDSGGTILATGLGASAGTAGAQGNKGAGGPIATKGGNGSNGGNGGAGGGNGGGGGGNIGGTGGNGGNTGGAAQVGGGGGAGGTGGGGAGGTYGTSPASGSGGSSATGGAGGGIQGGAGGPGAAGAGGANTAVYGTTNLSTIFIGSGGGGGAGGAGGGGGGGRSVTTAGTAGGNGGAGGAGGAGGGIFMMFASTVSLAGTIKANGGNGSAGSSGANGADNTAAGAGGGGAPGGGGGGGSGGSVFIGGNAVTVGTTLVTAIGGNLGSGGSTGEKGGNASTLSTIGGSGSAGAGGGGAGATSGSTPSGGGAGAGTNGGDGRIHIEYVTSLSGTTSPAADSNQISASLNLDWEYWNGSSWASLESVTGFTDGTSQLTQDGAIYWNGQPTNWRPYSVNGSPELYFIRASLNSSSLSYSTSPVENTIRTDILLIDYLYWITGAGQTLFIGDSPPGLDRLMRHGKWFSSTEVYQPFTF